MARGATAPLYQQIADELRTQITSRALRAGAQLPTELALADKHGVTRATARQAIGVLINEGLVVSSRPRGHFVRQVDRMIYRPQSEWRPQPASPEMDRFMEEQTSLGREPSQVIGVELVTPPDEVARRLDLDSDQTAVVRRRVRFIDGMPFNTNDSYYPMTLVEGSPIMYPADIPQGANQVLTELGAEQVRAIDEIEVRMPTPDEVHRLDLSAGVPVAVHRLTGYTHDGRPVRCTINVLPGDRHVILFERAKPAPEHETDSTTPGGEPHRVDGSLADRGTQ
ncbi:MAG: UTRA domain-containing protein [Pseudonocardiaceae bacterium]|nr:UTRA domain-containing protein [Pseudonocardiaceae bacterium]